MSDCAVAAIIVFHDEAEFLPEAVASALAQAPEPLEIILVDSLATAPCRAVANELACRHAAAASVVTADPQAAGSLAAARRAGFRASTAPLVAFLDADDAWLPGKIAEQATLLRSHPEATFVYGRTLLWHSWNGADELPDEFLPLGLDADRMVPAAEVLGVLIANRAQTPTTCNALIRREPLAHALDAPPEFANLFEDQELWVRLLAQGPAYVSSRTWARYRQRPGSLSAAIDRNAGLRERRRLLRWMREFLETTGQADSAIRAQLRRELCSARLAEYCVALAGLLGG